MADLAAEQDLVLVLADRRHVARPELELVRGDLDRGLDMKSCRIR